MNNYFTNLKVVLIEPSGPINVGSIARLCANFEVNELRIVSPQCDIFSIESKKMALKGKKYLDNCKIFSSLEQAISDCDLVIASSGRIDLGKDSSFESPENIAKWILSFDQVDNIAILFGREDRGLSNSELLFAQKTFTIKTSEKYPSLNLSHAVSVILYELNKGKIIKSKKDSKVLNLASSKQIYDSFLEIEDILIRIGYLSKDNSYAKISKFKKYIMKTKTSRHELNILRGIVHQINWFLNNSIEK